MKRTWVREQGGRLRLGWRLALFTLLFMTLLFGLTLATLPLASFDASADDIVLNGLIMLIAALVAGWVLLRMDGRGPDALGMWWNGSPFRQSLTGLGLGLLVAGTTVGIIAVGGGIEWSGEPGTPSAWWAAATGSFLLLAGPAAAEEALLRGYPLQAFSEKVGRVPALAITSVVFAALHFANPEIGVRGFASITAAGLFLGAVYFKTASLWAASAAHLAWNWALGFWADLPVSGLDLIDQPYVVGRPTEPAWWSGGAFGPEGSWVATAVLTAATVVLLRTRFLKPDSAILAARPLSYGSVGVAPETAHPPGPAAEGIVVSG